MALQKGDVVLAFFPFSNLSQTKLRPAVVVWVSPINQDVTICFITSQDISDMSNDEFQLHPLDSEFLATGLKVGSKIRVTKIVTIERRLVNRRLGKLGNDYISTLNTKMVQAFQLS